MSNIALPAVPVEGGLSRYFREVWCFPILKKEEEQMLALRWRDKEDIDAAHKLVTSHLRLVCKIAMGYKGYGLPMADLVSEGNIGLMKAVKKFEPDKGFRLSTYAMWWIKAAITEHILNHGRWSSSVRWLRRKNCSSACARSSRASVLQIPASWTMPTPS